MLEVSNVSVYDLKESIISCRNSMRLDSPQYTTEEFEQSLKRAIKLAKVGGGSGETNFRTGIRVSFDLKYSQYITKQLQRYHWFDYVCSSSLMHRITKMNFDKCCNKYVSPQVKHIMQNMIGEYNNYIQYKNPAEIPYRIESIKQYYLDKFLCNYTDFNEEQREELKSKFDGAYIMFMCIVSNCPMGTELFVRVSTNYEQLATIYKQRKHHKLKEDYAALCEFIESLPYAKELIINE